MGTDILSCDRIMNAPVTHSITDALFTFPTCLEPNSVTAFDVGVGAKVFFANVGSLDVASCTESEGTAFFENTGVGTVEYTAPSVEGMVEIILADAPGSSGPVTTQATIINISTVCPTPSPLVSTISPTTLAPSGANAGNPLLGILIALAASQLLA